MTCSVGGIASSSQMTSRQRAALQEYGLRVITDVVFADEPISLQDAYDHSRIFSDSNGSVDDVWLEAQIPAAREYCERFLGRSLAPRTMELATSSFPTVTVQTAAGPAIDLPFGPVQSITSVKYLVSQDAEDTNGDPILDSNGDPTTEVVELTLDASTYALDNYVTPNRLVLAYGESWPSTLGSLNSVKVRYVTGYVSAPDTPGNPVLPRMARSAMLLMLGHLYENREALTPNAMTELPLGVQALLDLVPDRERLGMA